MAIEHASFDELGNLVVGLTPRAASRILLYVEFEDGVIGPSLFYELDGELRYVERPDPLFGELRYLQQLFGPDVRAMEFEVRGAKFSADFTYKDQFDKDLDTLDRENAILEKHFGHSDVKT